jgi:hypothetical protein
MTNNNTNTATSEQGARLLEISPERPVLGKHRLMPPRRY